MKNTQSKPQNNIQNTKLQKNYQNYIQCSHSTNKTTQAQQKASTKLMKVQNTARKVLNNLQKYPNIYKIQKQHKNVSKIQLIIIINIRNDTLKLPKYNIILIY